MSQADSLVQKPSPARHTWVAWLVAGAAAFFVFTAITWLMLTSTELKKIDKDLAKECKQHAEAHEEVRDFFLAFTHVGGRVAMTIAAVVGVLAMAVRKHFLLALIWFLATGGGALLNFGVKESIDRQRPGPELRDPNLRVRHDSFPSGHAMGSTIGYGMWLYAGFLFIQRRSARAALVIATVVLVVLIGFSRIYLRAHWFSDILGGYALGSAWLTLSISFGKWLAERKEQSPTR